MNDSRRPLRGAQARRFASHPRTKVGLLIAAAVLFAATPSHAAIGHPAKGQADSPIVAKCKADLAKRFGLPATQIKLIEQFPMTWRDASLGMPQIGMAYADVITPGMRLILGAKSSRYLYTTGPKAFRYGGPVGIWAYSMLYTMPVADEPNLNGDLWQCSLIGTNATRLASGVTEFFPQEGGLVVLKRRDSRSGHSLLLLDANNAAKPKLLRSAFDFGAAATDEKGAEWAAYLRPTLGAKWSVAIGRIGQEGGTGKVVSLPNNARPGKIAWLGGTLMILVQSGEITECFKADPDAATGWKAAGVYEFPGNEPYMLNKSETLEVTQTDVGGKPAVEVARVWFTGDRKMIARIPGVKLSGFDVLGPFVVVLGKSGKDSVTCTVDIFTGEIMRAPAEMDKDAKPFRHPMRDNPNVRKK